MTTPSVCFVCHEYPPEPQGGIGTFTQMVARALVRDGWQARVVGFRSAHYSGPDEQEDRGVRIYRLRAPSLDFLSLRAVSLLYRTVARWARQGEIDLVEVPDAQGWAAGWPSLPIPVVSRVHGSATYFARELGRPKNHYDYWRERLSMGRSDAWCSVSRYSAEKTQKIFGLKPVSEISYVPIDLPAYTPHESRSRNRVVYTGTLTPKKGIPKLIEAWPAVLKSVPQAELHVYGKDYRRDGRTMAESLLATLEEDARQTVHFHGHRTRGEVLEVLTAATVAVFPSYAEAFAFAPIEAMGSGCPTIYSPRTSGPELMTHNENGLLIDPDRPQELARGIISILQDDALALRIGDAGRKRVQEEYTVAKLLPKMQSFYQSCIGSFGRKRAGRVAPPQPEANQSTEELL